MEESLLIVVMGTSKLRPMRTLSHVSPSKIILIIDEIGEWKESTAGIAESFKLDCGRPYQDKISIEKAVQKDYDSVFSKIYEIIEKFDPRENRPCNIDVSATTGIALSAVIGAASLFENTHVLYVHAIFKPNSIKKIIEEEEDNAEKIKKQDVIEIPVPLVRMSMLNRNEYPEILKFLYQNGGKVRSINMLTRGLGIRNSNQTTKSIASSYGKFTTFLHEKGMITKTPLGKEATLELTKFGTSFIKMLEKKKR